MALSYTEAPTARASSDPKCRSRPGDILSRGQAGSVAGGVRANEQAMASRLYR